MIGQNEPQWPYNVRCHFPKGFPLHQRFPHKPEFKDKAEEATGYERLRTWIRKDNFVQQRAQAWETRANRVKYFNSLDIEQIDDIWTIKRRQVITTRNDRQEHASVLQLETVTYNTELSDDIFTTENIQRGLD